MKSTTKRFRAGVDGLIPRVERFMSKVVGSMARDDVLTAQVDNVISWVNAFIFSEGSDFVQEEPNLDSEEGDLCSGRTRS